MPLVMLMSQYFLLVKSWIANSSIQCVKVGKTLSTRLTPLEA